MNKLNKFEFSLAKIRVLTDQSAGRSQVWSLYGAHNQDVPTVISRNWGQGHKMRVGILSTIFLAIFLDSCFAVKKELFKTCEQNGFCHRNRHYAKQISSQATHESWYSIDEGSLNFLEGKAAVKGVIIKKLAHSVKKVELPFVFNVLQGDKVRFRVDEEERLHPKEISLENKRLRTQRYNEAWKYALKGKPEKSQNAVFNHNIVTKDGSKYLSVVYGAEGEYEARIDLDTVQITIFYQGVAEVVVNDKQYFNVEHWRTEDTEVGSLLPEEVDFDSFHDSFKDSSGDKLPFGPESIAVDVSFNGFDHVYGIPEHADTFSLRDTTGSDPYRLFNVDIFEYETHSELPMYGSIPFMLAHKKLLTAGLLWLNGADTYIDILKEGGVESSGDQQVLSGNTKVNTHWISENGIVDLILFLDKTPQAVNKKYGELTGNTQLPQLFSLGYHQCRWNYNDVEDVIDVHEQFDKHEIPYDVIWLDVEYTIGKRYFTWKQGAFDDHVAMNRKLAETGRNLVAIIDPHLKVDYEVSNAVASQGLAVQNSDNQDPYKGHCWPGESLWIDTFNPKSQAYWNKLFANNTDFSADETNLHIWNDMNEPSVFSGPETTAPKDIIHYGNWEHRSVHNIYSLTFHEATFEALNQRYVNKRPFVLTRAYYTGSQRTAAMWTGDNMSKWEYLKIAFPMILTQQVVGMPFAGADIGGFFGNPSSELLTRWYQAGIWYPFMRAHAHIDSKRREPYLAGEQYTPIMKDTIRLRYALLPIFYTSFYHSSVDNSPVLTPLLYSNPENPEAFAIEDQFFVGDSGLLVKPVTDEGATSVDIYLPDEKPYYDYFTYELVQVKGYHTVEAPLDKIPILLQGGHIIPRKDRYRRSSKLMTYDPYTLVVAVDEAGKAQGGLYIDDFETYNYKNGEFVYVKFRFDGQHISSKASVSGNSEFTKFLSNVKIGKIIVVGATVSENTVTVKQTGASSTAEIVDRVNNSFTIRNPNVSVGQDWTIVL